MSPQAVQEIEEQEFEVKELDEVHKRATSAAALFRSVRARMRGRSSRDYPAILESVLERKLSHDELDELDYKPSTDPEELIKHLWSTLVFEAYFTGHPRVEIPVHLLPNSETAGCYLWNDSHEELSRG